MRDAFTTSLYNGLVRKFRKFLNKKNGFYIVKIEIEKYVFRKMTEMFIGIKNSNISIKLYVP